MRVKATSGDEATSSSRRGALVCSSIDCELDTLLVLAVEEARAIVFGELSNYIQSSLYPRDQVGGG